tara:strand:+ start:351 stop:671 length:321 start_codon:yes stop_codon:yes gene_type:complete
MPQLCLHQALGVGWVMERTVNVWKGTRKPGWPGHYKLDIANPDLMIAIEVDGGSHGTMERQAADDRKDQFLRAEGWSVYRVSNAEAMSMSTISRSVDILRILRTAY